MDAEASEETKEQYIVKTHLACLPFVRSVIEKLLQKVSKIESYGTAAYALVSPSPAHLPSNLLYQLA